ncbi:MAG TPA: wax ester/triacylglycerol synthase domain-containing protein [Rudaea sp.]|uniref:wax ester/triacylglycerol synthase domain-containing protein n=1 Tax=Rudaea sp. TaxID=2136325 RepID=UPI002F942E5F
MRKRLRPLSGLDAGFLYLEAAGTPMHVGSVMLLQSPRRRYDFYKALVAHMRERRPRAAPLRRVLREAPLDLGHPMWNELPRLAQPEGAWKPFDHSGWRRLIHGDPQGVDDAGLLTQ